MSTNIALCRGTRSEPIANIPFKPYWLQRLPAIIESLNALSVATIDRRTFESIFQLRRRRAIELMHLLGSYRSRRGFVLDRSALIEILGSPDTIIQYHWVQQTRGTTQIGRLAALMRQGGDPACRQRIVIEFTDQDELVARLLAALSVAADGAQDQVAAGDDQEHYELQLDSYQAAIQAIQRRRFSAARRLFAKACAGPVERIRASAEDYLRICDARLEVPFEPSSLEELYAHGVALLNDRRLPEARRQFERALHINARADYVYYALAACLALSHDMTGAYDNLRSAIDLEPRNRIAARHDSDFDEALNDPMICRLLALF